MAAKPAHKVMPGTTLGGPCLICGEYIFGGAVDNGHLEKHFREQHGHNVLSHQPKSRKQRLKEKPPELFNRKQFLQDRKYVGLRSATFK